MALFRQCSECGKVHPGEDFKYKNGGKILHRKKCIHCFKKARRERQRKWVAKNRAKHNEKSRQYRKERYANDPEFREREKWESRETYADPLSRARILERQREAYAAKKLKG